MKIDSVSFFDNSVCPSFLRCINTQAARSGAIWFCLYDPSEGNDKATVTNTTWCGNSLLSKDGKCTGPGFYCGGAAEVIRNRFGSDHVPSDSKVKTSSRFFCCSSHLLISYRSFCDTHKVTTVTNTVIPGINKVPFTEDDKICIPWKEEAMKRLNA